ncbi:MAG: Flp family type IVb pilin [Terracidiphilus sp.]|jgi:pilus assembly protein Flp/PilA
MGPKFRKLVKKLRRLLTLNDGQDLVEYALVIALVAFGATAGTRALATGLNTAFTKISSVLASDT